MPAAHLFRARLRALLMLLLPAVAVICLGAAAAGPGAPGAAVNQAAPAEARPAAQPSAIQTPELAAGLRADVERLASDEFAGRRVGEPGCELAVQYLEGRLAELGVAPAPGNRGYRYGFSVTKGVEVVGEPHLVLAGQELKAGVDYSVATFSASGKLTGAPLLFAGYGITAPELGWDDYAGLDAKGAAVLVMRGEPQENDEKSVFAGKQPTIYSDIRRKAAVARDHGAAALLVVDKPARNPGDELPETVVLYSAANFDIPVVLLKRAPLQNCLIGGTGLSFAEMEETIDLTGKPNSAPLGGAMLSLDLTVEKNLTTGFNLAGIIPGSDPQLAGEYVVIGAHYDHIGIGGAESAAENSYGQVHPGADDNASGVAAVLALAGWARANPGALRRSLLVCLFSAEEEGALGSAAIVKSPPVPAGAIDAMLNFDMVGRLRDDKLLIVGTGTAKEFEPLLAGLPERYGLKLAQDKMGVGGSDNTNFYKAGYPALFFFTGAHPEYHTPADKAATLNYEGLGKVLGLASALLLEIANRAGALTYVKEEGAPAADKPAGEDVKVSMGTVPSFEETTTEPGYVVGDVRPGGPADQAGIKGGDRIVKIRDRRIANVYDFMYALEGLKPGDVVDVTVVRAGAELQFKVTLALKPVQQ